MLALALLGIGPNVKHDMDLQKAWLVVGAVFASVITVGAWMQRDEGFQIRSRDETRARHDDRHRASRPEWLKRWERKVLGINRLGETKRKKNAA